MKWWMGIPLGVAGLLAIISRGARKTVAITVNPSDWTGWVWPVPVWHGRVPVASDKFDPDDERDDGHRQHFGVDLTFQKRAGDPQGVVLHDATKAFISPAGTPILAAGPGRIWSAKRTGLGLSIQIDHGNVGSAGGVNSFYQHLDSFARPWKKGDEVKAGEILGTMGYPPAGYHFRHLHFELWFPVRTYARDPLPYMKYWQKVSLPSLAVS